MFRSDLWLILWWCIYGAYMVIFIRIRRSTKLEYTISLLDDDSLICCCWHIPIVLGAHMDEDCWCWWYQEVLTKDLELKIHSAIYSMLDTWMITQSCIVGDMMMMSSYLYDDRLILTYVDWCRCSHVMILGSCRSWCWWDGYGVFHIWFGCWSRCCWQMLME